MRSRIAGDDTETDFGMIDGWDIGCRTMEFYVNNLAKEGTRKEGRNGLLGKGKRVSGVGTIGAKKNPAWRTIRGTVGDLVGQFPARADRMRRRVKRRHRAK